MTQTLGWLGFALATTILFAIVFDTPASAQSYGCRPCGPPLVEPRDRALGEQRAREAERKRLIADVVERLKQKPK